MKGCTQDGDGFRPKLLEMSETFITFWIKLMSTRTTGKTIYTGWPAIEFQGLYMSIFSVVKGMLDDQGRGAHNLV